jgi:hypothetical protein
VLFSVAALLLVDVLVERLLLVEVLSEAVELLLAGVSVWLRICFSTFTG